MTSSVLSSREAPWFHSVLQQPLKSRHHSSWLVEGQWMYLKEAVIGRSEAFEKLAINICMPCERRCHQLLILLMKDNHFSGRAMPT